MQQQPAYLPVSPAFGRAVPDSRGTTVTQEQLKKRKSKLVWVLVLVAVVGIVLLVLIVVAGILVSRRQTYYVQGGVRKKSFLLGRGFVHKSIMFEDKDRHSLSQRVAKDQRLVSGKIFVAISSYRDPELCYTLEDLFDKAYDPNRVYVGVLQQNHKNGTDGATCSAETFVDRHPRWRDQVRIKNATTDEARGPTWARHHCEKLWRQEEWYMMTDSHMRFEPGWDVQLMEMVLKCRRPRRTVITMYPEGFHREEDKQTGQVKTRVDFRRGYRFEQLKSYNQDGIVEFESVTSHLFPPKVPKPVPMYAACFVFGHSDMIKNVPYHPDTPWLFFGEEMFMACRLYTHGWDLVGPTRSVCYHLWDRSYRQTYFSTIPKEERLRSVQKIKDIMLGKTVDPVYGLGKSRTAAEFFDYLGVDFANRSFTRPPKPWKPPAKLKLLNDEFVVGANNRGATLEAESDRHQPGALLEATVAKLLNISKGGQLTAGPQSADSDGVA